MFVLLPSNSILPSLHTYGNRQHDSAMAALKMYSVAVAVFAFNYGTVVSLQGLHALKPGTAQSLIKEGVSSLDLDFALFAGRVGGFFGLEALIATASHVQNNRSIDETAVNVGCITGMLSGSVLQVSRILPKVMGRSRLGLSFLAGGAVAYQTASSLVFCSDLSKRAIEIVKI